MVNHPQEFEWGLARALLAATVPNTQAEKLSFYAFDD